MKKIFLAVILTIVLIASILYAAGSVYYPTADYGVVSVGTDATQVYAGAPTNMSQRVGVFVQNQSSSVTVYCGPSANITTNTAPIMLTPGAGINFNYSTVPFYCITSSSSANVGYMVIYKGPTS